MIKRTICSVAVQRHVFTNRGQNSPPCSCRPDEKAVTWYLRDTTFCPLPLLHSFSSQITFKQNHEWINLPNLLRKMTSSQSAAPTRAAWETPPPPACGAMLNWKRIRSIMSAVHKYNCLLFDLIFCPPEAAQRPTTKLFSAAKPTVLIRCASSL